MGVAQLVIGIVAAVTGGLGACLLGVVRLDRKHPWLALVCTLLTAATIFCGTVAAAEAKKWSFGVGAGLAGIALLLPLCRYIGEHILERRRSKASKMWLLPEGTIEGESFYVALSIALDRYEVVDAFYISRLPLFSLQRIHATHSIERQGLSLAEFRTECLSAVAYRDISGFGEMASLLLFVQPAKAARCRRWFVTCAIVLELFINSKDDELVDVVRFVWKTRLLCPTLKYELTRNALYRLKTAHAKYLCHLLVQENAQDTWIKSHPALSENAQAPPDGRFKKINELTLKDWHLAGDLEECRLCGYRPRKRSVLWEIPYKLVRFVFRWNRYCKACGNRTMGRKLCKRPASEGLGEWEEWDAAAVTSSGGIGLQELFGEE